MLYYSVTAPGLQSWGRLGNLESIYVSSGMQLEKVQYSLEDRDGADIYLFYWKG